MLAAIVDIGPEKEKDTPRKDIAKNRELKAIRLVKRRT